MLPGHCNVVPPIIGDICLSRDSADPSDIERQPAPTNEQRLSIRRPHPVHRSLTKNRAARAGPNSRCDREVLARQIEVVGFLYSHMSLAIERRDWCGLFVGRRHRT